MPLDCDKYFAFDRERDRALWPVSPALHAPVAVAVAAPIGFVGFVLSGVICL